MNTRHVWIMSAVCATLEAVCQQSVAAKAAKPKVTTKSPARSTPEILLQACQQSTRKGDGLETVRLCELATQALRSHTRPALLADALHCTGKGYYEADNCEMAEKLFLEADAIFQKHALLAYRTSAMTWLALCPLQEGRILEAKKWAHRTLFYALFINDTNSIPYALKQLAMISKKENRIDDALRYYDEALQFLENANNDQELGQIYMLRSEILFSDRHDIEAAMKLVRAYERPNIVQATTVNNREYYRIFQGAMLVSSAQFTEAFELLRAMVRPDLDPAHDLFLSIIGWAATSLGNRPEDERGWAQRVMLAYERLPLGLSAHASFSPGLIHFLRSPTLGAEAERLRVLEVLDLIQQAASEASRKRIAAVLKVQPLPITPPAPSATTTKKALAAHS